MMENLYILSGRIITVRDKLRKVLTVAAALVLRTLAVCGFLGMILGMGIFVERSAALGLLIGAVSVFVMIGAAKADGRLDVTLPLDNEEEWGPRKI